MVSKGKTLLVVLLLTLWLSAVAFGAPEDFHEGGTSESIECPTTISSPVSPSLQTSKTIFQTLIMPATQTAQQKKAAKVKRDVSKMANFLGTALRYEMVDIEHSQDGDIMAASAGMAWDFDNNISLGFLLPYDRLEFDDFDADRIGLVLFAQYIQDLNSALAVSYTAYANNTYTDFDFDTATTADDEINTYGGGLGVALTWDFGGNFVTKMTLGYQYGKDDGNSEDDDQHLIRAGFSEGFRIGDNYVVDVYGYWVKDISDEDSTVNFDDDFFEAGSEFNLMLSETWSLNIGYRKILDKDDFDSDDIYLGSRWAF